MKSLFTTISILICLFASATKKYNTDEAKAKNNTRISKAKTMAFKPRRSLDLIEENIKKADLTATIKKADGTTVSYEPIFEKKKIKLKIPVVLQENE